MISVKHSAAHFESCFQRFDGIFLVCCRFGNGAGIARKKGFGIDGPPAVGRVLRSDVIRIT